LHNNRLAAVVAGGFFMILAALLVKRVVDVAPEKAPTAEPVLEMRARSSAHGEVTSG
jgi:hypothetical protein